jgi:hypothetical protein
MPNARALGCCRVLSVPNNNSHVPSLKQHPFHKRPSLSPPSEVFRSLLLFKDIMGSSSGKLASCRGYLYSRGGGPYTASAPEAPSPSMTCVNPRDGAPEILLCMCYVLYVMGWLAMGYGQWAVGFMCICMAVVLFNTQPGDLTPAFSAWR